MVVFSSPGDLTQGNRDRVKRVSDWLSSKEAPDGIRNIASISTVPEQAQDRLVSKDGQATTLTFLFDNSLSQDEVRQGVQEVRDRLEKDTEGSSLEANLTGPAGVTTDASNIFAAADLRLLLAVVALVLVLLVVIYCSPILALLPLVTVGWVLLIVQAILGFAGEANLFSVSQQATSIMEVLIFGAGVDYTIFIVSRYREELLKTQDRHEAMRDTMRAVGEAIASSGTTVLLSVLALLLAALGLYKTLGFTIAIAVAIVLLGGLTLAPALLSLQGRAAFWPFVPRHDPGRASRMDDALPRGLWGRIRDGPPQTVSRPWLSVLAFSAFWPWATSSCSRASTSSPLSGPLPTRGAASNSSKPTSPLGPRPHHGARDAAGRRSRRLPEPDEDRRYKRRARYRPCCGRGQRTDPARRQRPYSSSGRATIRDLGSARRCRKGHPPRARTRRQWGCVSGRSAARGAAKGGSKGGSNKPPWVLSPRVLVSSLTTRRRPSSACSSRTIPTP